MKHESVVAHDAWLIKSPVPRPANVMIRMVADTQQGVHSTCSEHTGSFDDLMAIIETMLSMGDFVRSIHVYVPEGFARNDHQ